MYFTINDYKKIQKYLSENGIKDSSFPEYNNKISGNGYITINDRNSNYKISIKNFWNTVSFDWNAIKNKLCIC